MVHLTYSYRVKLIMQNFEWTRLGSLYTTPIRVEKFNANFFQSAQSGTYLQQCHGRQGGSPATLCERRTGAGCGQIRAFCRRHRRRRRRRRRLRRGHRFLLHRVSRAVKTELRRTILAPAICAAR